MVDRIGKGGAPPPGAGPTGPARPTETGKTFEVDKAGAVRPVDRVATPALDQLKAGKIDFNEYLEVKVQEATQHLEGLTPVQLDTIRGMLKDRMSTDPELLDLVKQATGRVPDNDE
jgi:hypothetical protein